MIMIFLNFIMATPSQFIDEWIKNEDWWFVNSQYIDAYITLHYQHLLDIDISNELPITQIIIYDQLPRHVFRNQDCNHIILYFLQKALAVNIEEKYRNNLSINLWCFSLLPKRHTNNLINILEVMKISWDKLNCSSNEQDKLIIKKFIKATYQRCPTNDQSKLIQFYPNNENFYPTKYMTVKDIKIDFADILDNSVYDNILIDESKFFNIKNYINNNENNIILSLSGGVDSMICSAILSIKYNYIVHINYCNRTTSDREEEFVKAWCDYMRFPLYIRRIEEINRPLCMENNLRDIYESYTRDVRYSTYKTVNSFDIQNKNRPISLNPIKSEIIKTIPRVILGHNKDDCLENIFTNIAHENHYENLNGMIEISTQDGIEFIRPLLNISKDEIRNFAYKMNYPFLPNSTPSWSQRGQIRTNIVPVLEKWDPRITESLFSLSDTIKDLHIILNHFVDYYLQKTITTFQNGIYEYHFPLENDNLGIIDIPKINLFWKVYLTKLCTTPISQSSYTTPSIKSLNNLTLKLKNWDNIAIMKIALKKNMEIIFTKTKCEIIYKSS